MTGEPAGRPPNPFASLLRGAAAFASALDNSAIAFMRGAGVEAPAETRGQQAVKTLRRWADIVDGAKRTDAKNR